MIVFVSFHAVQLFKSRDEHISVQSIARCKLQYLMHVPRKIFTYILTTTLTSTHHQWQPTQGVPKKVPSIEIKPFVVNLRSYTFGNLL